MIANRKIALVIVIAATVIAGTVSALVFNFFPPPDYYPTDKHPLDVVAADFDQDGNMDIATANRDGKSVNVFMGNGDGTVTLIDPIATDGGATSLAPGDIDGDGKLDLVVSNCEEMCDGSTIMLLSGKGTGEFEPTKSIEIEGVAYSVLLDDFNEDGKLDIAASDYPKRLIHLLLSRSEALSYEHQTLDAGSKTIALISADLNNDKHRDLVTSNHGADNSTIYLGNGDGTFLPRIDQATGDLPYAIDLEDIDNDKELDLLVAHSTSAKGRISVLKGDGEGSFSLIQEWQVPDAPIFIETSDFNADDNPDLIITLNQSNNALIYLNKGNGTFDDHGVHVIAKNKIYSAVITNLDSDSYPDLVSADYENSNLAVSLGGKVSTGSEEQE